MNRLVFLASVGGTLLSSTAMAQWNGGRIVDNTAVFQSQAGNTSTSNPGTGALPTSITGSASSTGTSDFRLGGLSSTDHTFGNWWWFRSGADAREFAVAAPSGTPVPVRSHFGNGMQWTGIAPQGAGSPLRFDLAFYVTDLDGAGTAAAVVRTILTVRNIGTDDVANVNLFNYVDYFLGGQDAGDFVAAGNAYSLPGYARVIEVQDTTNAAGLTMRHIGYGATGYGVGSFSAVGGQMGDSGIDDFADFNNATTPGDQSGVMQWNFGTIPAGGSVTAVADLVIPTPGAAALLGLGGLIAARRRRA
jgi:hypothetical protein